MTYQTDSYDLSREWFDFCFKNPDKISPNHSAIFFFAIEHCNRMGGKEKFGFPTQMTMDAIGIKKPQTYIKYFNDLCEWGFFILHQKSHNQYSSNIISLMNALPKNSKADVHAMPEMDKANIKHAAKQIDGISSDYGSHTKKRQSNSPIERDINKEKESIKEKIPMPFTSESFQVLWQNWKRYRQQEFKKQYKSGQSESAALTHLDNISGGNEAIAKQIIEQSEANQWLGLFPLKNDSQSKGTMSTPVQNGLPHTMKKL